MDTNRLEVLMSKIIDGDLEALEELYRGFHHAVFTYSLYLLRNRAQAEDNAQDVFLQIWAKVSSYKKGSSPTGWIMRITHNLAIDRVRRQGREISFEDVQENEPTFGEGVEQQSAERIDLETVLRILEPKDRQIVLLRAVADLSLKEVALLCSLPLSTVHWRYRRALRILSQSIKNNGGHI